MDDALFVRGFKGLGDLPRDGIPGAAPSGFKRSIW
jgi:hypothetical protein